jgi:GNAT superfamily N-acetyltransferase
MTPVEIRLRPFKESDIPFCRDSFYKGGASAPEFYGMDQNILKPGLRERFDRMKRFADITIACDFEHDEPLFGWCAVTNLESFSIVWWVYVKSGYRGFGFARRMVEDSCDHEAKFFPFRSRVSTPLSVALGAQYHPFLLEEFLDEDQEVMYI